MDYKTATIEELEERRSAIGAEIENPEADLNALEEEARSIKAELETRKADAEAKAEIRRQIANDEIKSTKITEKVEKTMDIMEIRNSKEYVAAYAKAIKTQDETECRAMLTEIAASNGQLPVPVVVEHAISHAWNESERIVQLCKHTNLKGKVKFSFELTNSGASIHAEAANTRPDEEAITIGVVTVTPTTIKKWITISDEALAMDDGNFLNYIFEEMMYNIVKKATETVISKITGAPTTATTSAASVTEVVDGTCAADCIVKALATLSAEAQNPVIVMNRGTWGKLESDRLAAGYAIDIFRGLEVVFTDLLPSFDSATSGACYAIVGDFSAININNIDSDVVLKFDELSLADYDLVKVIGKQYLGIELIKCGRLCRIVNN